MFSDTEEAQVITLRALFELWRNHQQMMVVLVDKLLKTQIVECAAVANWLFSKEMVSEFTKGYTWEMLHLTIRYNNGYFNFFHKKYPKLLSFYPPWIYSIINTFQENEQACKQTQQRGIRGQKDD